MQRISLLVAATILAGALLLLAAGPALAGHTGDGRDFGDCRSDVGGSATAPVPQVCEAYYPGHR